MENGMTPQLPASAPPPNPSELQQEEPKHLPEETKISEAAVTDATAAPRPKPEELVARAIAPVKPEYLRPTPSRSDPKARRGGPDADADADENSAKSNSSNATAAVVVKERKSRRQMKRERKQEQQSALNICPQVAKCGNANACPYKDRCRFSHDLDAFLLQKPADIEGACPFVTSEEFCPYGVTCRFSGTHGENMSSDSNPAKKRSEINVLKKDIQHLLWKNKFSFPKADAQLNLLGLVGRNGANAKCGANDLNIHDEVSCNPDKEVSCAHEICSEDECINDISAVKDTRFPKKAKTQVYEDKGSPENTNGTRSSEVDLSFKPHPRERKLIDFRGKLYLAPLTTVGNLPFRRVCKTLGADITCGEMAMCTNLLQGQASEWALLRRHSSEDIFGVQICGAYPDTVARAVELIERECTVDYIDINMGCPIDVVVNKGAGSALLVKPMRMKNVIRAAASTISLPLTVKVRTGYFEGRNRVESLMSDIGNWGASALTIHGRSRQQRYSKLADWDYIYECTRKAPDSLQVLGNGDIFSYTDWIKHASDCSELATCMIARGALIKPWIFTEIKERRHWDISSGERFNILKQFVQSGLEHWGSDTKGVETTRHFLLEWLSYTYRYIPVGLLDIVPQRSNWRSPSYYGRDDLETLMASDSAADWIRISEMLLGKVPEGFSFMPKHKSNAYDNAENG